MNCFYAINHKYLPLPEGLVPWAPTFSPDGKHILFHDYNGGKEWIIDSDGKNLFCVTGDMTDRPDFIGGFYYILPDEKRIFLSNELGDSAYILECEPNIYKISSHKFVPIDLSGDKVEGKIILGRRTYHLSPDGESLAYNLLRADGLIMLLCKLVRTSDRYVAADYFVLNPQGPESSEDGNFRHWASGGTLTEFKAFSDGGASFLFVSESEGGNINQYKRNFKTGEITRITYSDDWDEDGAFSPDGQLAVCASWRTMHRLEPLCRVPVCPTFLNQAVGAAIAVNYVSSFAGFANDLQPWLLSAGGDTEKKLNGQPLAPYCGGEVIAVNNIAGHPMWNCEGNRVLIQERNLTPPTCGNERMLEKGTSPNRIHIAEITRPYTESAPVVYSQAGGWAKRLSEYKTNADFQGTHILNGEYGTAKLTICGNLLHCQNTVEYENFSGDGLYVLNGIESVTGNVNDLKWKQSLSVSSLSGVHVGKSEIDLRFKKRDGVPRNVPPMTVYGRAESEWKGDRFKGIPQFVTEGMNFPERSCLSVHTELTENYLIVYVSADVYGDRRMVRGADVECLGQRVTTGENGEAVIAIDRKSERVKIKVTAGDNFIPVAVEIYLNGEEYD